ncbi:MAG: PD-(D/E)XK nuclease family protein [Acidimicrobiia bacterium]|nr:PD-(D/E)XK nuclease family protein [Acidimicrobiia bacterium]
MGHERLQVVGHGPEASAALADVVRAVKGEDPLAPVTVAVPHPWAGLSLRRALAARQGGVVNVHFLVLPRVAELLGAPLLAARGARPRTATVARAAVRAALRADPGTVLASVADHPATEAALLRLVDDLAAVGPEGRLQIAGGGPRPADLVALVERVLARVPGRYDRHDQARAAATGVVDGHPVIDELGHLVVHLPSGLSPAEMELITALAGIDRVTALLGTTGIEAADASMRRLQRRLEPILGAAVEHAAPPLPLAQRIITTTDPDEEVRNALRVVVERWEAGIPLERMAIVHPRAEPYARLLQEQAAGAGLPVAGTTTATLASSVAGRTLLGALDLTTVGIARDELIGWMAAAPMLDPDGRRLPTTRWDLLTRRAGIVAGDLATWNEHLDAEVRRLERRHQHRADDPEAVDERLQRETAEIERVRRFVTWLDTELGALERLGSWAAMSAHAEHVLRQLLGPHGRWAEEWPADQVDAGQAVLESLERLESLDEIEPQPSVAAFRRALAAELDVAHGRAGDFGKGLLVAPLHHAVAVDLDLVVVVGLAEGTLPGRISDDALLPDADRALADVDLPRRADAVVEQHHRFLAALAAAPQRVLLSPRGDLRQGRDRIPSRWLVDMVAAHVGRAVTSDEIADIDHPSLIRMASYTSGIEGAHSPVSLTERDLGDLLGWIRAGGTAGAHPLVAEVPALGAAFDVVDARRHGGFGRFTGHVTGVELPTFRGGAALSPTALERWPQCPRRYFFAQVLRMRAEERPEFIDRITARDRGSLVHEALELFFEEVIANGPKPSHERWRGAERARLHELFDEVAEEFHQRGLTGRQVLWSLDRDAIRRELDRFCDEDDAYRALNGAVPIATELPFGPDQPTQAVLELPGGRHISFRGFADRVDRTDDGRIIVLDYKTGKLHDEVKAIEKGGDPVVRGTKLQLPVYALAAAAAHGPGQVHAAYWHISDKGGWQTVNYDASAEADGRFVEVLATIADGIEAGVFPARPGDPSTRPGVSFENCGFCDFDAVCGRDRGIEWEHVRLAPELSSLLRLTGDAPDEPDAAPGDQPVDSGGQT